MSPKFIHAFLPTIFRTVRSVKEGETKTVVIPARVTIAWVPFSDTEIEVGIAWCSPEDQFSRRVGRQKAQGRLIAGRLHSYPRLTVNELHTGKDGNQKMSIEGILRAVNDAAAQLPNTPRWADEGLVTSQPLKLK